MKQHKKLNIECQDIKCRALSVMSVQGCLVLLTSLHRNIFQGSAILATALINVLTFNVFDV